ncbi:hypothetical protein D3C86_1689790 [compost metagenome]
MGSPRVDSSQSSTARTRASTRSRIMLSRRKSPWTIRVGPSGGRLSGRKAISRSMAAMGSISEARYCLVQRPTCLAK